VEDRERHPENVSPYHAIKIRACCLTPCTMRGRTWARSRPEGAEVVFERTAEVLGGLIKAYEDYESRSEKAWRV
jgi:hypothetical protein